MDPLVSVILVTHNAGDYLRLAAQSIVTQTCPCWELLLVDNASTDGSVDALNDLRADPRVRLIRNQANLFHNGGLRVGQAEARGQFIAIMDADDVSHPLRLTRQLQFLDQHHEVGAVSCVADTINGQGHRTGLEFTLCRPQDIAAFLPYNMPFVFPAMLFRRELLDAFPFRHNLPMSHDLDLLLRAAGQFSYSCVPELLFSYRRHRTSTTHSRLRELFAYGCIVRVAAARRRQQVSEGFEALLTERQQLLARAASIGQVFLHYARGCLQEGYLAIAAYHARQAIWNQARLHGALVLLRVLAGMARSRHRGPERNLRTALLGPLRSLGLQPFQREPEPHPTPPDHPADP